MKKMKIKFSETKGNSVFELFKRWKNLIDKQRREELIETQQKKEWIVNIGQNNDKKC